VWGPSGIWAGPSELLFLHASEEDGGFLGENWLGKTRREVDVL